VIWMKYCGTVAKAGGQQRRQTSSWCHGSLLSARKIPDTDGHDDRYSKRGETAVRLILVKHKMLWAAACILSWVTLTGCQAYRAHPLDSVAVERTLTPPEPAELQVQAEALRHPLLAPLKLDLQDGVSADEAAVLAVLINPSLRAARDERGLADAQLLRAGLLPDPELSFDFETPTGGETAGTVNAFGLGVSWDVASLIAHSANERAAQARRAAVEMDVAWQEWQVAQNTRAAVFQLASLTQKTALLEETQQHLQENVKLISKAVASGTRTNKDLSAAQAQSRKAQTTLLDLRRQAAHQRLQLNQLLGLPPEHEVRLSDQVGLPSSFQPPGASDLLADLERRRLDLVALRRGYDSQEATVRAAILNQFPRLTLGPTVGRDIENVDTAGFGLAVDLPVFSRNRGTIAVEKATRQKLFDEYVNRVFQARSDVEMLRSRIQFLNEQIAAAVQAQSELDKLVEEYRTALAAGRTDILTYYTAWNDMTENRMSLVTLKGQLARAIVDLESATGLYHIQPVGRTSVPPEKTERKAQE
jgi:cobalt-zinc-cadmium efflux system outer membrane protein